LRLRATVAVELEAKKVETLTEHNFKLDSTLIFFDDQN